MSAWPIVSSCIRVIRWVKTLFMLSVFERNEKRGEYSGYPEDIFLSGGDGNFLEPGDFYNPGVNHPPSHVSPELTVFYSLFEFFVPRYLIFASARSLFAFALAYSGAIWRALSKESRASV